MNETYDGANALNEKMKAQGMLGGREAVRPDPSEPRRDGLRARVNDQLRRALSDAGRLERLSELDHLLTKHPETARILELMEDLRG